MKETISLATSDFSFKSKSVIVKSFSIILILLVLKPNVDSLSLVEFKTIKSRFLFEVF